MRINVSNVSRTPVIVDWCFKNDMGEIRQKSLHFRARALNQEVSFDCEADKEAFHKSVQFLEERGTLVFGRQNDKSMNSKAKEKASENKKETKEVQEQLDQALQKEAEEKTQGEIQNFQVEVTKKEDKNRGNQQ